MLFTIYCKHITLDFIYQIWYNSTQILILRKFLYEYICF